MIGIGSGRAQPGITFTTAGVDPAIKAAVERAAADPRNNHPDVTISIDWSL